MGVGVAAKTATGVGRSATSVSNLTRWEGARSMTKELFMAAHEQLVEEAMEADPNLSWDEAYDRMADLAYDRMRENLFDMADNLRKRAREGLND